MFVENLMWKCSSPVTVCTDESSVDPFLHIADLEGHYVITGQLNMHAVNLRSSKKTIWQQNKGKGGHYNTD
jgi:hypothetical protein